MAMPLASDYREFLSLLNSAQIEYLIVGGFAVAAYAHPRSTGDIGIWVAACPETAAALMGVLRAFGFGDAGATETLLATPDKVIRMGVPPVRIELLTGLSGVEFGACWPRRVHVDFDGLKAFVIQIDDLRTNKRAAGRMKDLADIEALE